jgi:hypothetical protein
MEPRQDNIDRLRQEAWREYGTCYGLLSFVINLRLLTNSQNPTQQLVKTTHNQKHKPAKPEKERNPWTFLVVVGRFFK